MLLLLLSLRPTEKTRQAPFAAHLLREKGRLPAGLAAVGAEPAPAAEAEQQLIPGTPWAMRFDDDGEPEYVHTMTGEVVFEPPAEVEAAMNGGGHEWS